MKKFYCISCIHIEKSSIHRELSVYLVVSLHHFVCRLAGAHTKSQKIIPENYLDTSFLQHFIEKITNKKTSPASFSKKVPEKHIINFLGLSTEN